VTILLTGGTGRLGRELLKLNLGIIAPPRRELDITDAESVARAFRRYRPEVVIHAAAYTDVKGAETEWNICWAVNVGGTRNVVRARGNAKLVHISSDYVFYGDRGNYLEADTPGPVRNTYALSKLVAEEVARTASRHLIIRTSFRPREWAYPVAFTDLYTSQDYVDIIAPEIALAVAHSSDIPYGTLHIGTERKSVFELARRRKPDVKPGSKAGAGVELPDDISLNIERWQALKADFVPACQQEDDDD
jgi:dTDP-4-dehydrorhamnose reductase